MEGCAILSPQDLAAVESRALATPQGAAALEGHRLSFPRGEELWDNPGADNVCELMCHVGYAGVGGDDFNTSTHRERELRLLTDQKCLGMLRDNGVQLVSVQNVLDAENQNRSISEGWWKRAFRSQEDALRYLGQSSDSLISEVRKEQSGCGRSIGRLLVLASCTEATGNSVTGKRLCAVARGLGWAAETSDIKDFERADILQKYLRKNRFDAVLGTHFCPLVPLHAHSAHMHLRIFVCDA